jgi:hypothetical protein
MSAKASVTAPQYRLIILSGPEKGTAYQLMSSQIRIGRELDNDVVIKEDPRLSRHHAMLEITDNQVEVYDVSQKNKILVNNQKLERARLQDGMVFTIGTTDIRLERLPSIADAANITHSNTQPRPLLLVQPNSTIEPIARNYPQVPPHGPPGMPHYSGISHSLPRTPGPQAQKKSPMIYIIIGIVVIGAFVMMSSGHKKPPVDDLRTPDQIESTIKESEEAKEKLRKKIEKLGANYQVAQSLYIQGFRDYKKGQYSRAIESFRGAIASDPEHQLAQRYLKLAQRRLDELLQFNMIQGRQYRARQMYERCAASFNNVMNLAPDKSSSTYKEAKSLQEECELQLQEKY